ncbi:MAG: dTMP kinase [Bacteroidales bacterium]|nr:dTMP kinase [Bacteroidales bacterium]
MSFIVIEGLDGAGKSTQIELLKQYLTNKQIKFEYIHFPTTDSPIFGDMISRFLRGDFGSLKQVHPNLVALLFAGDRYNMANTIRDWQSEGNLVINDRYVYSNIGFQCAKLNNEEEANKLFEWIIDLEFNYYKIPQPDLSIFLDVPFEFTKTKLTQTRKGADREYLNGKTDIHEANLVFQNDVRNIYLKAIKKDANFIKIDCSNKDGNMLDAESISSMIIKEINNRKLIKV